MTRIRKILLLQQLGYDVKYSYHCGENYSRLVIDVVEETKYTSNTGEQVKAGKHVDKLFEEALSNGKSKTQSSSIKSSSISSESSN